tara:strand:+ start:198 stop:830 length:633 start_codon:yes stop_codon:yes gene_type:complete
MKILVACEESQAVTIELRKLGHEAYSNDLIACSGGYPQWHIQEDSLKVIKEHKWDMILAFPPCTHLTVTGNRWFNIERYGDKAIQRHKDREWAVEFFKAIYNSDCPKIAIENPVGVMSTLLRKPDQIVQPYHFGDAFEKKTCLWLKGLPKLEFTNVVKPPERTKFESGRSMPTWYAEAWKLPQNARAKLRSKTFPGIAQAMAKQWTTEIK